MQKGICLAVTFHAASLANLLPRLFNVGNDHAKGGVDFGMLFQHVQVVDDFAYQQVPAFAGWVMWVEAGLSPGRH